MFSIKFQTDFEIGTQKICATNTIPIGKTVTPILYLPVADRVFWRINKSIQFKL
jgi:hypothetical protein